MLDRAYELLPEQLEEQDRFQIPRARVTQQGRRSVIMNFNEIAAALQRDPDHLLKFLLKELATKGELEGSKLTVQGRFRSEMVDRKLDNYAKEYVFCQECGKPDTKIIKEDRYYFLKCEACGAKHVIKRV